MPSLTLTDLTGARFPTISFFLLLFLLSALAPAKAQRVMGAGPVGPDVPAVRHP